MTRPRTMLSLALLAAVAATTTLMPQPAMAVDPRDEQVPRRHHQHQCRGEILLESLKDGLTAVIYPETCRALVENLITTEFWPEPKPDQRDFYQNVQVYKSPGEIHRLSLQVASRLGVRVRTVAGTESWRALHVGPH